MKYYDLPASPNARRVRIFMAEKDLHIEKIVMDIGKGEHKTQEYLAKNSLGMMPLLELDDGTCIAESATICRYLEELHPENPLHGSTALERAQVDMWQRRMELELLLPVINIFVNTHEMWKDRVQVPQYAEVCRDRVIDRMAWLDRALEDREFIAGDQYSVADIAGQCAILMAKLAAGLPIPDDHGNLAAWWSRVSSRPTARA